MRNKLVASVLAVLMAATLLTACGGNKETEAPSSAETTEETKPAKEETAEAEETEETEVSEDGEMVSDEVFEMLQDNYALVVEYHDAVAELYNSDEIAADPDIEEVMSQAYDVIDEMGKITQDSISQEDALELNKAMVQIIDALSLLVDGMEVTENTGDGEMVSDETFAEVQQNYEDLATVYNIVAEAYNNGDVGDADIEDTMNQAREIIEEMGTITQDNLTEESAVELVNAMVDIVEVLGVVADSIG